MIKLTTKESIAYYMSRNLSLSRKDDQFISNVIGKCIVEKMITTSQDELFNHIIGKYKRQFLSHDIDYQKLLSTCWHPDVVIVQSSSEISISYENGKIVFKSPYIRKMMHMITGLKCTKKFDHDSRIWEFDFSASILRKLVEVSETYSEQCELKLSAEIREYIQRLNQFSAEIWQPTIRLVHGRRIISSCNETIGNELSDINELSHWELIKWCHHRAVKMHDSVSAGMNFPQLLTARVVEIDQSEIIPILNEISALGVEKVSIIYKYADASTEWLNIDRDKVPSLNVEYQTSSYIPYERDLMVAVVTGDVSTAILTTFPKVAKIIKIKQ